MNDRFDLDDNGWRPPWSDPEHDVMGDLALARGLLASLCTCPTCVSNARVLVACSGDEQELHQADLVLEEYERRRLNGHGG